MKTKELIKHLKRLPQDVEIIISVNTFTTRYSPVQVTPTDGGIGNSYSGASIEICLPVGFYIGKRR